MLLTQGHKVERVTPRNGDEADPGTHVERLAFVIISTLIKHEPF